MRILAFAEHDIEYYGDNNKVYTWWFSVPYIVKVWVNAILTCKFSSYACDILD